MARTAIPLSTFTTNADLNDAGTTVDQANGMNIQMPSTIPASGGIDRLVIYATNTFAGVNTVTIRAGGTTYNIPFEAGKGDLVTGNLSASTGTVFITGLEGARYAQSDGSINIDFSATMTGKITAFLNPRTI